MFLQKYKTTDVTLELSYLFLQIINVDRILIMNND